MLEVHDQIKHIIILCSMLPFGEYACRRVASNLHSHVRRVTLTHLPLDKMAAILADDILDCIFFCENDRIPIKNFIEISSQESN